MTVNMNLKKTIIVAVLILASIGCVWWFMETAPNRKAKTEIKILVDFAQRQALEIAIIEQSAKLANYKRQMAKPVSPVIVESNVPDSKGK